MNTNPSRKHRAQGSHGMQVAQNSQPGCYCPSGWEEADRIQPWGSLGHSGARQHCLELDTGGKRVQGPVNKGERSFPVQGMATP